MELGKMKKILFRLFFVMTEGIVHDSSAQMLRKTVVLLAVDVLQVLRVMSIPKLGWRQEAYDFIKMIDPVYDCTTLISKIIPRYSFFVLAAVLVTGALANAFYVMKQFQSGDVKQIGPVKLLRLLSAAIVTIFFSSVIKWLLIPLDCLVSEETSFSSFLHGADAPCTPFAVPEVAVTVPTIFLVLGYVGFAVITSLLSFEVNPLSRNLRASFTGRVEVQWLLAKCGATFLPFLADYLTPLTISLLLWVACASVMYMHITLLPFHRMFMNLARGGIYMMVTWLAFSCVIVSFIAVVVDDNDSPHVLTIHRTLQALLPVAFIVGLALTHWKMKMVDRFLGRLKGEFDFAVEVKHAGYFNSGSNSNRDEGSSQMNEFMPIRNDEQDLGSNDISETGSRRGSDRMAPKLPRGPRSQRSALHSVHEVLHEDVETFDEMTKDRSLYQRFFKSTWDSPRAFRTSAMASVAARSLLHHRDINELPFLEYVVKRGLQENPGSHSIIMLYGMLINFVLLDSSEAARNKEAITASSKKMAFDHQYIVYALDTKATQDKASENLGKGGAISAIQMMEFNNGIEEAKKHHKAAVNRILSFWSTTLKRRSKFSPVVAAELVTALREYSGLLLAAQREYVSLLDKYPSSMSLLRAYADFLDTLMNDEKEAEKLREKAQNLEDDRLTGPGEEGRHTAPLDDNRSAMDGDGDGRSSVSSSEKDSYRSKVRRFLHTWLTNILGHETQEVSILRAKINILLVFIFTSGLAIFFMMDAFLFSATTKKHLEHIQETGLFARNAFEAVFLIRSMVLDVKENYDAAWAEDKSRMVNISHAMMGLHWENYQHVPSKSLLDFYYEELHTIRTPVGHKWVTRNMSFWDLGLDFPRRLQRASKASWIEFQSDSWNMDHLSDEKRNIVYLNENIVRSIIPAYDKALHEYGDVLQDFGKFCWQLIYISFAVEITMWLVLTYLILSAITSVLQRLQHRYVICCFALSMPKTILQKVHKHYRKLQKRLELEETLMQEGDPRGEQEEEDPYMQTDGYQQDQHDHEGNGHLIKLANADGPLPNLHIKESQALVAQSQVPTAYMPLVSPKTPRGQEGWGVMQVNGDPYVAQTQGVAALASLTGAKGQSFAETPQLPVRPLTIANVEQFLKLQGEVHSPTHEYRTEGGSKGGSKAGHYDERDSNIDSPPLRPKKQNPGALLVGLNGALMKLQSKISADEGDNNDSGRPDSPGVKLIASGFNSPDHKRSSESATADPDDPWASNVLWTPLSKDMSPVRSPMHGKGAEVPLLKDGKTLVHGSSFRSIGDDSCKTDRTGNHETTLSSNLSPRDEEEKDTIAETETLTLNPQDQPSDSSPPLISVDPEPLSAEAPEPLQEEFEESDLVQLPAGQSDIVLISQPPAEVPGGEGSVEGAGAKGTRTLLPLLGAGDEDESDDLELENLEDLTAELQDTPDRSESPLKSSVANSVAGTTHRGSIAFDPELAAIAEKKEGIMRTSSSASGPDSPSKRKGQGVKFSDHAQDEDVEVSMNPERESTKDLIPQSPVPQVRVYATAFEGSQDGHSPRGAVDEKGPSGSRDEAETLRLNPGSRPTRPRRNSLEVFQKKSQQTKTLSDTDTEESHGADVKLSSSLMVRDTAEVDTISLTETTNDYDSPSERSAQNFKEILKRKEKPLLKHMITSLSFKGSVGKKAMEPMDSKPNGNNKHRLSFSGSVKQEDDNQEAHGNDASNDHEDSFRQRANTADNAEHHEDGLPPSMRLVQFNDESKKLVVAECLKIQNFWTRSPVYIVSCMLMIMLSGLHLLYPARHLPEILRLGPTTEQGDRRVYLVKACAHYTRELILDDGVQRLTKHQTASALQFHLDELKRADKAVRFGNDLGIDLGAEFHNDEHNRIMYEEGCPWRADPTNCSAEIRPEATGQGLAYLLNSYMDAVEAVLDKHAPIPFVMDESFHSLEQQPSMDYQSSHFEHERLLILDEDEDVKFVLQEADHDLDTGLEMIVEAFIHETDHLIEASHVELRLLFVVYILCVFLLFFRQLLWRTFQIAISEPVKAKEFMIRFPLHILTQTESEFVSVFFQDDSLSALSQHLFQHVREDETGHMGGAVGKMFKTSTGNFKHFIGTGSSGSMNRDHGTEHGGGTLLDREMNRGSSGNQ